MRIKTGGGPALTCLCIVHEPLCVTYRSDGTTAVETRCGNESNKDERPCLASGQIDPCTGGDDTDLQPPLGRVCILFDIRRIT